MILRWIGAFLIFAACGTVGFLSVAAYKKEEQIMRQLANVLDYLSCELQYHLTPLPQLSRMAAMECTGVLNKLFLSFADELDMQLSADAELCMKAVLAKYEGLPLSAKKLMIQLGHGLGRFDLNGQLKDLEGVRQECRTRLHKLAENKEARLRTYRTLGLSAGAAIAILLI